jgi:ABC-type Mn2+/Zn2+ transport system ATPase subunit
VLELQRLTRRYGDLVALDDLSFTVAEGQLFGFVGSNGAGKTTAMRIVLGVLAPDAGEVRWRGQRRNDELRHRVGHIARDHGQTFSPRCARVPLSREQRAQPTRLRAVHRAELRAPAAQPPAGRQAPARPRCRARRS